MLKRSETELSRYTKYFFVLRQLFSVPFLVVENWLDSCEEILVEELGESISVFDQLYNW